MQWYLAVLKNYVGFSGRARRKEYWMFTLINAIVGAIINVIQLILGLAAIVTETIRSLVQINLRIGAIFRPFLLTIINIIFR
ncbi:TPA: DUF805 domain-containing protein [Escherichia coli]|uniref:DUF805 domain-containing protein n=1 Tax=Escherichia coli TaxID=562 RepID=UPI0035CC2729